MQDQAAGRLPEFMARQTLRSRVPGARDTNPFHAASTFCLWREHRGAATALFAPNLGQMRLQAGS
jgi:hypothetical protein